MVHEAAGTVPQGHLLHTILLAVPIPVVLGYLAREELRKRRRRGPPAVARYRHPALMAGVLCSLGAAAIHASVTPEHVREYLPAGIFFLITCAAQVGWAGLVTWRPTRELLLAGGVGNAAIVVLWLASRTIGLPLGESGGRSEAVGAIDAGATVLELLLVASVLIVLRRGPTSHRVPAAHPA